MAMTKKFKVSFDVTAVIDSESKKNMNELLVDLAKKAGAGEKLNPFKQELLIQGLTHGPEGAVAFCIRQGLREFIRDCHSELSPNDQKFMRFSPAAVREVFK